MSTGTEVSRCALSSFDPRSRRASFVRESSIPEAATRSFLRSYVPLLSCVTPTNPSILISPVPSITLLEVATTLSIRRIRRKRRPKAASSCINNPKANVKSPGPIWKRASRS